MPIYLLGARTPSVQIPDQPVSISVSGSVDRVALYVDPETEQKVVRVNPHLVIIPALNGTGCTVGVEPVGAATFEHDTVVHLAIAPDSPGEFDPVQVGFDPVNVSGAQAMELATLTPQGGRVEVKVRALGDAPLSPLANMARTAGRRRAGNRQRPRDGFLSIGVDASASMRRAFDDGSVGAAVDIAVGVADVAGIGGVRASLVGARCSAVEAPAAELAQALADTPVRWSAGARWSQLPGAEHTIVVTDSLSSVIKDGCSPMFISDDTRLRAVGPLLASPPAGVTAERHLCANPTLVDELAAGLLSILT